MREERLEVSVTFDERRDRRRAQAQLSRIAQFDQRTALRTNVCTGRKRTCGPQGGTPQRTSALKARSPSGSCTGGKPTACGSLYAIMVDTGTSAEGGSPCSILSDGNSSSFSAAR